MDSLLAEQLIDRIANGDMADVPLFGAGDGDKSIVWDAGSGAFVKATFATSAALAAHIANVSNPHAVTAAQVGAYTTAQTDSATRAYVGSRGQNLVANGSGLLGTNYNFSTLTFDAADTHGGGGSFLWAGGVSVNVSSEYLPVDVERPYRLTLWIKSGDADGTDYDATNRQYAGVEAFDADRLYINPGMVFQYAGSTLTTLAADLDIGDSVVVLTDAAGWNNSADYNFSRQIAWWPYTNAGGYSYTSYTYSRNITYEMAAYASPGLWAAGGISGNTITLTSTWPGPALPAGTPVRNSTLGGSYQYTAGRYVSIPQAWTRATGVISGTNATSVDDDHSFPYGTAFVKIVILANLVGNQNVRFSDIWFGENFASGTPVSGAAATAGGTYGATEQAMLQAVYNAALAFGELTG